MNLSGFIKRLVKFLKVSFRRKKSGYVAILLAIAGPALIYAVKLGMDTSIFNSWMVYKKKTNYVYKTCASAVIYEVAKYFNPSFAFDTQMRSLYRVAARIYNLYPEHYSGAAGEAIPGLMRPDTFGIESLRPRKATSMNTKFFWINSYFREIKSTQNNFEITSSYPYYEAYKKIDEITDTDSRPFIVTVQEKPWKIVVKSVGLFENYAKVLGLNYLNIYNDKIEGPHLTGNKQCLYWFNSDASSDDVSAAEEQVTVLDYEDPQDPEESTTSGDNNSNSEDEEDLTEEEINQKTKKIYLEYDRSTGNPRLKVRIKQIKAEVKTNDIGQEIGYQPSISFEEAYAVPAKCNVDIVLSIPTNAAACNPNNLDSAYATGDDENGRNDLIRPLVNDFNSEVTEENIKYSGLDGMVPGMTLSTGGTYEASGTYDDNASKTPIFQIAHAYQKFLRENFLHTQGVSVGIVPYSGKLTLREDRENWTRRFPTLIVDEVIQDVSRKERLSVALMRGAVLYGTIGEEGKSLSSMTADQRADAAKALDVINNPSEGVDSFKAPDIPDSNYIYTPGFYGVPIMFREGKACYRFADIMMTSSDSSDSSSSESSEEESTTNSKGYLSVGNPIFSGDLLSTADPKTSGNKFFKMNLNPCYQGFANMLGMFCERDCTTYLPNPYYIIELTPNIEKVCDLLGAFYPYYDPRNTSSFSFLAVTWGMNLFENWTQDPYDKQTDDFRNSGFPIDKKSAKGRKKVIILIVNKPDAFEAGELTYLGFNNDYSEMHLYDADRIDFTNLEAEKTGNYIGNKRFNLGSVSGQKSSSEYFFGYKRALQVKRDTGNGDLNGISYKGKQNDAVTSADEKSKGYNFDCKFNHYTIKFPEKGRIRIKVRAKQSYGGNSDFSSSGTNEVCKLTTANPADPSVCICQKSGNVHYFFNGAKTKGKDIGVVSEPTLSSNANYVEKIIYVEPYELQDNKGNNALYSFEFYTSKGSKTNNGVEVVSIDISNLALSPRIEVYKKGANFTICSFYGKCPFKFTFKSTTYPANVAFSPGNDFKLKIDDEVYDKAATFPLEPDETKTLVISNNDTDRVAHKNKFTFTPTNANVSCNVSNRSARWWVSGGKEIMDDGVKITKYNESLSGINVTNQSDGSGIVSGLPSHNYKNNQIHAVGKVQSKSNYRSFSEGISLFGTRDDHLYLNPGFVILGGIQTKKYKRGYEKKSDNLRNSGFSKNKGIIFPAENGNYSRYYNQNTISLNDMQGILKKAKNDNSVLTKNGMNKGSDISSKGTITDDIFVAFYKKDTNKTDFSHTTACYIHQYKERYEAGARMSWKEACAKIWLLFKKRKVCVPYLWYDIVYEDRTRNCIKFKVDRSERSDDSQYESMKASIENWLNGSNIGFGNTNGKVKSSEKTPPPGSHSNCDMYRWEFSAKYPSLSLKSHAQKFHSNSLVSLITNAVMLGVNSESLIPHYHIDNSSLYYKYRFNNIIEKLTKDTKTLTELSAIGYLIDFQCYRTSDIQENTYEQCLLDKTNYIEWITPEEEKINGNVTLQYESVDGYTSQTGRKKRQYHSNSQSNLMVSGYNGKVPFASEKKEVSCNRKDKTDFYVYEQRATPYGWRYVEDPTSEKFLLVKYPADQTKNTSKDTTVIDDDLDKWFECPPLSNRELIYLENISSDRSNDCYLSTSKSGQLSKMAEKIYSVKFPLYDITNLVSKANTQGTVNFNGIGTSTVTITSESKDAICRLNAGEKTLVTCTITKSTFANQTTIEKTFQFTDDGEDGDLTATGSEDPDDGRVDKVFDDSTYEDSCYKCTIVPENAEISSIESIGVDKGGVIEQGGKLPYLVQNNNKFISHIKALEFKIHVRPTIGSGLKLSSVYHTEEETEEETEEDSGEEDDENDTEVDAKESEEYKLFPDENSISYSKLSKNNDEAADLSDSENADAFEKTIYFNYAPNSENEGSTLSSGYTLKIPSSIFEKEKPITKNKFAYIVSNANAKWTASNMKLRWHGGSPDLSFADEGVQSPDEYNSGLSTSVQVASTTGDTDENNDTTDSASTTAETGEKEDTTYSVEQLDYTLMKSSEFKVTKNWLEDVIEQVSVELKHAGESISDLKLQLNDTATNNETLKNSLQELKNQLDKIKSDAESSDIQEASNNVETLLQNIKQIYLEGNYYEIDSEGNSGNIKTYAGTDLSSIYRITEIKNLLKEIEELLSQLLERPKKLQTIIDDLNKTGADTDTAAKKIDTALDSMESVENAKAALKTCTEDLYKHICGHIKSYNPRAPNFVYSTGDLTAFSSSTDTNPPATQVNTENFKDKVTVTAEGATTEKDIKTYCFGYMVNTADELDGAAGSSADKIKNEGTAKTENPIANAIDKILYSKDTNAINNPAINQTGSSDTNAINNPAINQTGSFEYFAKAFSEIWDACQITEDQLGSEDWRGSAGKTDDGKVLYQKDSEKIDPDDLAKFINKYASSGFSMRAYLLGHAYRKDSELFTQTSHKQTDDTYELLTYELLNALGGDHQKQEYYDYTNNPETESNTEKLYLLTFKGSVNSESENKIYWDPFGWFTGFVNNSGTSAKDLPVWLSFPTTTTLSQSYRNVMSYFLIASINKKEEESNKFLTVEPSFLGAKDGSSNDFETQINSALKNLTNTSECNWSEYSAQVKSVRNAMSTAFEAYKDSIISDPFADNTEAAEKAGVSADGKPKNSSSEQVALSDVIFKQINSRVQFFIVLKAIISALYGKEISDKCGDIEKIATYKNNKSDIIGYFTDKLKDTYVPKNFFRITVTSETETGSTTTVEDLNGDAVIIEEKETTEKTEDKTETFNELKKRLGNHIKTLETDLKSLEKNISDMNENLKKIDATNSNKKLNQEKAAAMKFTSFLELLTLAEDEVAAKTYSTHEAASIYDIYEMKSCVRSIASIIGTQRVNGSTVEAAKTLKKLIDTTESTTAEVKRARIVWLLDDKFSGTIVTESADGFDFDGLKCDFADTTEEISDDDDHLSELGLSAEATKIHRILGDKAEQAIVYDNSSTYEDNKIGYILSLAKLNTAENSSGTDLKSEIEGVKDKNLFYIFQSEINPDSSKENPGNGHGIKSVEFQLSSDSDITGEKNAMPDKFTKNTNSIVLNQDKSESDTIKFPGIGDIEIEVFPMEQPYIELPLAQGGTIKEYFDNPNDTKTLTITPTQYLYIEGKNNNQKTFTFTATLHNVEVFRVELEEVPTEEAVKLSYTRRFDFSVATPEEVTGDFGEDLKFTGNIGRKNSDDVYFGIQDGDTIKMEARYFGPADANFIVETQDGKSVNHSWQGADEDESDVAAAGFIRKFFNIIRRTFYQFVSFFAPQDTKLMFADFSYPVNAVLFFGYGDNILYKYKNWQYPDAQRRYMYQSAALSRVTLDACKKFKQNTDARIYVILYRGQPEIETEDGKSSYMELKRCASSTSSVFEADNEEELQHALQKIADDIKKFAKYEPPMLLYQ